MCNVVSKTDTYSKAEADAFFLPKGASYLKAESDAKFQPIGDYAINGASYLKAESDSKFQPIGDYAINGASYLKAESDSKYATVDSNGKLSLPVNYYTASDVDTKLNTLTPVSLLIPANGTDWTQQNSQLCIGPKWCLRAEGNQGQFLVLRDMDALRAGNDARYAFFQNKSANF